MPIHVEATDVLRLIVQFLRENGLHRSLNVLTEESGIKMNCLEDGDVDHLVEAIVRGEWDRVISMLATLSLSPPALYSLHELMTIELLCSGEHDAAKSLLYKGKVLTHMRQAESPRFTRLENLLTEQSIEFANYYGSGATVEEQRGLVASELSREIPQVPKERLLSLLGEALRQEVIDDKLPASCTFDIFRGIIPAGSLRAEIEIDLPISTCFLSKRFAQGTHVEAATFSSTGRHLAIGSADGFIELINSVTGERRADLPYQNQASTMMVMEHPVICLEFCNDESLLAVGSLSGEVTVWRVDTGGRVGRFLGAHKDGTSCVRFTKDHSMLITAGYDGGINLWSVRSAKIIRQFKGHTSFVTDCRLTAKDTLLLSSGADGQACTWDLQSGALLKQFTPFSSRQLAHEPIRQIVPLADGSFMLCSKSGLFLHVSADGGTGASVISLKDYLKSSVVSVVSSPHSRYLYLFLESGMIGRYDMSSKRVELISDAGNVELIGGVAHARLSQLVTFDLEGNLKFWKPDQ